MDVDDDDDDVDDNDDSCCVVSLLILDISLDISIQYDTEIALENCCQFSLARRN